MSTTTTNYSLIKPELTDAADITAMNENWDKIDAELNDLVSTKGDLMRGDLTIKKVIAPAVHLIEENGAGGTVQIWNNALLLTNKNTADDALNYRFLSINNIKKQSDVSNALVLVDVTSGVENQYTVLHSGNIAQYTGGIAPATVE